MKDWPIVNDLAALLMSQQALMDVRAPIEFAEGAFPTSHNLSLMNDTERAAVGTCYKQHGQTAAIALGHRLVSGVVKAERVAAWQQFIHQHPNGALYCFRGGLRSRISQQWIYEHTGVLYPRVAGGYKALRRFLLDYMETDIAWLQAQVITGRTGSGKTQLLRTIQQHIDLEALANHRGSAFGAYLSPQPTQIHFENHLITQLLYHQQMEHETLLFEDESINIGSLHIPLTLMSRLRQAPLLMLQVPNEERIQITYQEYVVDMLAAFLRHYQNESLALNAFETYLLSSLAKIKRRLGGERFAKVEQMMRQALIQQRATGSLAAHYDWVSWLLVNYYDPMYDYQLTNKQQRVRFSGTALEIREYLAQHAIR